MIRKTEKCTYCDEVMDSKTAKKKFCSTLCRVYWNRKKVLVAEEVGQPLPIKESREKPKGLSAEVLSKIKEIEARKCPSYMNVAKFREANNKEIEALRENFS